MRKSLISAGVLVAGLIMLAIIVQYGGQGPKGRHPYAAIPEPTDGTLFLYFEGKNASTFSPLPVAVAKIGGRRTLALDALNVLSPLFEKAGETAVLLAWEENTVHFYMAAQLTREITQALSEGRFPQEIPEKLQGVALQKLSHGAFVATREGTPLPLYIRVNGSITLIASSAEKMDSMALALEGQTESIDAVWKVELGWPNHILISDGGLFSGVASMEGLPATKGNLLVSAAWRTEPGRGEMKWKLSGLNDIFSASLLEDLQGTHRDACHSFPEPLVAAAGFNIPTGILTLFEQRRFSELLNQWGIEETLLKEILPGPCVLSLCGSSKFLVFSLPGLLMQLPERGQRGEAFAESFWKREWSALVPSVEKLDDFPSGGTTPIPFSILAAANFRMLQIGLIDREALRNERFRALGEYAPTLSTIENIFFWAYLDMPKLASALQNLGKTGRMAEKMGKNLRMSPDALFQAARALEGLGSITVVMLVPDEGFLEWRELAIIRTPTNSKKNAH